MARRPNRPKRGLPRPPNSPRKAFPNEFGEGSIDEVDPTVPNDERTTWHPNDEHLDPGEVTSWISGQSDTPDLPDFERTEAKGPPRATTDEVERTQRIRSPRRRATDHPGASKPPIASQPPRRRKSEQGTSRSEPSTSKSPAPQPPRPSTKSARRRSQLPKPSPAPREKSRPIANAPKRTRRRIDAPAPQRQKRRAPTPQPAPPRSPAADIDRHEPTVRSSGPSQLAAGPVRPQPAPPRHNISNEKTVPRAPQSAPPVPQPRPGPNATPMPAPQRMESVPRAGRSIPVAPPVPRPHGYGTGAVEDPSASRHDTEPPGQVVAAAPAMPSAEQPTSILADTEVDHGPVDEVVPPIAAIPNDAPTVVRPELSGGAPAGDASGFGASFQDEPTGGEPTQALPPPDQRHRPLASTAPKPPPAALPGSASYSPPPPAPNPSSTPAPAPRAATPAPAARSTAPAPSPSVPAPVAPPPPADRPAPEPQRSSVGSSLPKGVAIVDDDDEGFSPLHMIYGGVFIAGMAVVLAAVLIGLLALLVI